MVRKYTKTRKQYKSKSISKSIPRKTKKNKFSKNKSRKIRGGSHENNDYVFAGVSTNATIQRYFNINDIAGIPIFLPNDNTLKNTLPGRITFWVGSGDATIFNLHLLLPVLYNLNYRGLNFGLLSTKGANGRYIFFYDNNETPIIDYKTLSTKKWPLDYKVEIKNMELKYPGLFQRMYVTEEEERVALEELERKENEEKQVEQLSNDINEKQQIYAFQELREDLKNRKNHEIEINKLL